MAAEGQTVKLESAEGQRFSAIVAEIDRLSEALIVAVQTENKPVMRALWDALKEKRVELEASWRVLSAKFDTLDGLIERYLARGN